LFNESRSSPESRIDATLAPRWHTGALVALLSAVALTGTLLERSGAAPETVHAPPTPASRILGQYLPILVVNWGLVLYCCRAFRRRNVLPALLGARWHGVRRASADLGLALAAGVAICAIELLSARLLAMGRNAAIASLLPSTGAERLTWALVALSAGFCEEVVYRGYLQTQLGAFTGQAALGVLLQAVLFGLAHLEQGPVAAVRIGVYGLIFGVLAKVRGSLLPGIICHIGIDLASGLWH
jgi:membrane protease YdiL (CAAX protease family)